MRLLLDTHIFLWYISSDPKLTPAVRTLVQDPGNEVFLSAVSLWEATIKNQIGKLPLPDAPGRYLSRQRERHQMSSLPLDESSVAYLSTLPNLHRDPFDRMLICQALNHQLTLVTMDGDIRQYEVPRFPE